ncbi:hypothetical protein Hanom_Chr12g01083631 [Helianthus anomalus]
MRIEPRLNLLGTGSCTPLVQVTTTQNTTQHKTVNITEYICLNVIKSMIIAFNT